MSLRVLVPAAVACGLLPGVGVATATAQEAVGAKQLAEERKAAVRDAYQAAWEEFRPFDLSKGDGEPVYRWSCRWMEAERDLAATRARAPGRGAGPLRAA